MNSHFTLNMQSVRHYPFPYSEGDIFVVDLELPAALNPSVTAIVKSGLKRVHYGAIEDPVRGTPSWDAAPGGAASKLGGGPGRGPHLKWAPLSWGRFASSFYVWILLVLFDSMLCPLAIFYHLQNCPQSF